MVSSIESDTKINLHSLYAGQSKNSTIEESLVKNKDTLIAETICESLVGAVSNFIEHSENNSLNFEIPPPLKKTDKANQHQRSRRAKPSVVDFSCKECNIKFMSIEKYLDHSDLHSLTRHFPCDICNRRYESKGILERHKKIVHFKVKKTFQCEMCSNRKFLSLDSFKKHLSRFHRKKYDDSCTLKKSTKGLYYIFL